MRHGKHTAKLGRNSGHRKAMLVNLACSLIEHEQIKTTVDRAKELRRVVDKLITHAKKGGLHHRRLVVAALKVNTPVKKGQLSLPVKERELQSKKLVVQKLFNEIAERFAQRPGGYTRIIRLGVRVGDAAKSCLIQLVEAGAPAPKKSSKKASKAESAPKSEAPKAEAAPSQA